MSFSVERLESALNLLHKGMEIIGENAVIYAGIAYTYFSYVNLGIEQEEHCKKAEEFVTKALNIDSEIAEAHFVLGCINFLFYGKARKGIGHLQRAHSIRPDDTDICVWLALGYDLSGRTDAAMSLTNRSIKIDPINPVNYMMKGINYFFQGQFDMAQSPFLDFYRLGPESPMAHMWKSIILIYNDCPDESYDFLNEVVKEQGQDPFDQLLKFLKYAIKGDKNKLPSSVSPDNIEIFKNDLQGSYHIATFYSYLGEKEKSLEWLENAVSLGLINYPLLSEHDKLLNSIRTSNASSGSL